MRSEDLMGGKKGRDGCHAAGPLIKLLVHICADSRLQKTLTKQGDTAGLGRLAAAAACRLVSLSSRDRARQFIGRLPLGRGPP